MLYLHILINTLENINALDCYVKKLHKNVNYIEE